MGRLSRSRSSPPHPLGSHSGAANRSRRLVPRRRPLHRLPLRSLSGSRARRPATRSALLAPARAGTQRPHLGDPATLQAPGTWDPQGWLTIGLAGHQPELAETYISAGSPYLCSVALLPLGLPPSDPFWSAPAEKTTWERAWSGEEIQPHHALASS